MKDQQPTLALLEQLEPDAQQEVLAYIQLLLQRQQKQHTPAVAWEPGLYQGKIKLAPDFDEPLDDFKDYMY